MSLKSKREAVIEFKKLYLEYLELDRKAREELDPLAWMAGGSGEDDASEEGERITEVRSKLNRAIPLVDSYVDDVGEPTSILYAPPPAIGGWSGRVDLLPNMFIKQYRGLSQQRLDMLDRAIGRYDYHIANRWKNWVNPLYWLGRLLHAPFRILQIAGFDGIKAEASLPGRVFKLIITSILAVLTTFVTAHKAWEAYTKDVGPAVERALHPTVSASPSPNTSTTPAHQ